MGTVLLAGAGAANLLEKLNTFFGGDFPVWALCSGGICVLVGLVGRLSQKPTYGELLDKHDDAVVISTDRAKAINSMIKVLIFDISTELAVYQSGMRTSFYCHSNEEFMLLSRVSSSPELQKFGRLTYPEKQGSIWKAWDEGETVITGFPEAREAWESKLVEEHGFSRAEVAGMSMQSRSLMAIRVDKLDGTPIGVLVIESVSARGVNSTHLDRIRGLPAWRILVACLATATDHFPAVAHALRSETTTRPVRHRST
ncbi:hypothetical protein [Cryobacterium sp. PH31-O1]|uniref:hypothetical protein n=1 Tax=Cryobacterium sp. PH31-O1 TaxID=3046306 RepID=UPI0024B8C5F5|nr:hypothetical protein [Cryobacterium sp. PH31-O1]MDJ0338350.1 hypothetical protein [Cryobacterium sp. PH31-O1]